MSRTCPTFVILAVLSSSSLSPLHAQAPADPSGHWEGSVQGMARFELDLARNDSGVLIGTVAMPDEGISGLPLLHVSIDDGTLTFYARGDQRMQGVFSADGKSITGDYSIEGFTIPFTLTRKGDARIVAAPRSAPVSKALEGRWNGTIETKAGSMRLALTLSNHPDGTATGAIVNLDQGGMTFPVAIAQEGTDLSLDIKAISAGYSGALNQDGTELVGSFTQGSASVPLRFQRAR
jgi:hypothetical protein